MFPLTWGILMQKTSIGGEILTIIKVLDQIAGMYGCNQIINEPTNLEPHCDPSCIDLIFCSQHNLIQTSDVAIIKSFMLKLNLKFSILLTKGISGTIIMLTLTK